MDELLDSEGIWRCLECYECYERCFQRFGMIEPMRALQRLAIKRGLAPKATQSALETFKASGRLTKPSKAHRHKLGLPPLPEDVSMQELQALVRDAD
ncbi:MAG: hypothetical protein ACUVX8_14035 [Candidatus Zipacnadales bacterium]